MPRRPPRPTLFPYTTLFRSYGARASRTDWVRNYVYPAPRTYTFSEIVTPDAGSVIGMTISLNVYVRGDRKSTRLNSSHRCISYAVFCLKKKNKHNTSAHDEP